MTGPGASAETTARGPGRVAMRREAVRISDALHAAGHARADGAFATMAEAAAVFGKSAGNSDKYVTTSMGYPPFRRRNMPVFSHHREIARLPEAECQRLLDQAAAENWTRAEMRTAAEIVERVAPEGARKHVAPEVRPV